MLKGIIAAAASALLVGCGEPKLASPLDVTGAPEAATPAGAAASVSEDASVPSLGDVVWAESGEAQTNAPQSEVASFSPEATRITAFVLADSLPAGTTVSADWEYNNTSLDAFSRQVVVPTAIEDRTWLSFHIDRGEAESWPAGVYEIIISLNGQVARQASVEVPAPA